MADRWVEDDGSESSRRRQRGLAAPSNSQSASGTRIPVPSAQQQARASRDPRTDPRTSTSPSQSQQTSAIAPGSRYLHTAQRGESSGYRTARTRASGQEDDSSEPSNDDSDDDDEDDEAEDDGEDNYNGRNKQSTTSRQQRSDSIMTTSEGTGALQRQARAAVQRLRTQGYREDQAIALVREELRKKLGSNPDTDASDNDQSGSGRGTGEDESALRARLPGAFQGRLAWKGQDLPRACEVIKLGSSDIKAVQSAVARFKGERAPLNVPLQTLH